MYLSSQKGCSLQYQSRFTALPPPSGLVRPRLTRSVRLQQTNIFKGDLMPDNCQANLTLPPGCVGSLRRMPRPSRGCQRSRCSAGPDTWRWGSGWTGHSWWRYWSAWSAHCCCSPRPRWTNNPEMEGEKRRRGGRNRDKRRLFKNMWGQTKQLGHAFAMDLNETNLKGLKEVGHLPWTLLCDPVCMHVCVHLYVSVCEKSRNTGRGRVTAVGLQSAELH